MVLTHKLHCISCFVCRVRAAASLNHSLQLQHRRYPIPGDSSRPSSWYFWEIFFVLKYFHFYQRKITRKKIYLLVTICWSIFFRFWYNFNFDCISRLLVPIRSMTTEQFSIFSSRRISESDFSDPSSLSSWTFVRPGCGFRYKTRSSNENALEWWTNCQYLFVSHGVLVREAVSFTITGFYWDTET